MPRFLRKKKAFDGPALSPTGTAVGEQEEGPVGSAARTTTVFVWGVWTALLLAAVAFVARYGSNVPFWDDWDLVPALAGEQPLTVSWLAKPHHEHRIPLPKLIHVALAHLTGCDFRAQMFFNVSALGALALAAILVAKGLRGRTSYLDVFFPLALLHWGHWANLLWSFQVQFICSTVLAGVLLLTIGRRGNDLTSAAALLMGICLILLPLCGANGLPFVPVLAPWLIYWGVRHWHSPHRYGKQIAVLVIGQALIALLVVVLYCLRTPMDLGRPTRPDLTASLITGTQFLSTSFGPPAAMAFWPFSGLTMLGLILLSTATLVAVWLKRTAERPRALGLLLFMGAMIALALGLGWGRENASSERGLSPHYVTLAVPTLCCAYLIGEIYCTSRRRVAQAMLSACMLALLPLNTLEGLEEGRLRRERMKAFEQDLLGKEPPFLLAERHAPFLFPFSWKKEFAEHLRKLHNAGIGAFRCLGDDPVPHEIPLPVVPARLVQARWKDYTGRGAGSDSYLAFALPEPQFVYAIRLNYSSKNRLTRSLDFQYFWKKSHYDPIIRLGKPVQFKIHWEWGRRLQLDAAPQEKVVTLPVYDTIEEFRIHPDSVPWAFTISKIVLLTPGTNEHPR